MVVASWSARESWPRGPEFVSRYHQYGFFQRIWCSNTRNLNYAAQIKDLDMRSEWIYKNFYRPNNCPGTKT